MLASSLLELGVQTAQSNFVQSIVDNSPSLISIRDRTGQFLLVNSAFTQWVNQDFSIIGKTLFQVFPAEVAARLHNQDKKVFEGGRAFEYDEALISQNGEVRTFLTLKFPVTQGLQRTAVCTIATDISDRIEYEERLKESESSLRIMIENIPNAIVIFDATEQRFEEANRAAEILFGLSRLQLCKMGPVQVSPEFQPDGTLSSESAKTQIESAVQGETVVFEWYHQHISTRQIPCEIRLVRLPKARGIRIMAIIQTSVNEKPLNKRCEVNKIDWTI